MECGADGTGSMKEVRFEIPGYCQPWQRTLRGFITPAETRAYQAVVKFKAREAMRGQKPFDGFVGLEIEIICAVPASWSKKKKADALAGKIFLTHWDVDNQIKQLFDSCNRVVYEDNRQINSIILRREYGDTERVIITARSIG